MKKITFLLILLTVTLGFSQAPTNNATAPPARDAGNVISIYGGDSASNPYTDITGVNYTPNWSQPAPWIVPNPAFNPGTGNLVLFYDELSYQGTDFAGNPQNASAMEFLHVDIWTPDGQTIRVSPINNGTGPGEVQVPITTTAGAWTSVDIPKASFTGMTWDSVFQFIFVRPDFGSPTPRADVYLDNIYFWKAPVDPMTDSTLSNLLVDGVTIPGFSPSTLNYTFEVGSSTPIPQLTATTTVAGAATNITQASAIPGSGTVVVTSQDMSTTKTYTVNFVVVGPPTAAPTPPNRPAADVKSIFSDVYTPIATLNYEGVDGQPSNDNTYDTSWCPANTSLIQVAGNDTNKVTGLGCEGVSFVSARFDATGFTHFHMDIYTDSPTMDKSFNIKFSNWNNTGAEVNAIAFSATNASTPALPSTNPGTWISFDMPLTSWTAGSRNDLVQFVITSDLGTVYYDNLYLHKNTVLGIDEFETTGFKVYPNPSQNNWTIKSNSLVTSVQVFDVLGKQVLSLNPNAPLVNIDGTDLSKGLYFARINANNQTSTVKLIKN